MVGAARRNPVPEPSRLLKKAFEYGQRAKSILIRRPQRKIDSTEYGNRIAVCAFAGAVCRLSDFFNSLLGARTLYPIAEVKRWLAARVKRPNARRKAA